MVFLHLKSNDMETELRELQLKCLEILNIVDKICRKNNIQYSLCGGSVVGAHLYKGFLPWDDDIDIMLTRDNYNKLVKILPQNLPSGFTFQDYHTGDVTCNMGISLGKVYNENTTLVENTGDVNGIFMDVVPYDKIPENPFLKSIDLFLYKRSMTINQGKLPGNSLKNRIRSFLLDTVFSNKRLYFRFFQYVVELLGKTSNYTYRELFGAYYFCNMIPFRPSVFENYTEIEFEGKNYMIVRDYIEYLQTRYNRTDFREPQEKQVPHHYEYVNFDLPYREFLKQQKKIAL